MIWSNWDPDEDQATLQCIGSIYHISTCLTMHPLCQVYLVYHYIGCFWWRFPFKWHCTLSFTFPKIHKWFRKFLSREVFATIDNRSEWKKSKSFATFQTSVGRSQVIALLQVSFIHALQWHQCDAVFQKHQLGKAVIVGVTQWHYPVHCNWLDNTIQNEITTMTQKRGPLRDPWIYQLCVKLAHQIGVNIWDLWCWG